MMMKTRFQAAALVALGAFLGYAAATGRLSPDWSAKAAIPGNKPAADKPAEGPSCPGCCSDGLSKAGMLALANRNEAVADKAAAVGKKPNILILWGDDLGWYNASCYNHGVMGYKTPNIDRLAKEGGLFTDWYGQQSCTAGRAASASPTTPSSGTPPTTAPR